MTDANANDLKYFILFGTVMALCNGTVMAMCAAVPLRNKQINKKVGLKSRFSLSAYKPFKVLRFPCFVVFSVLFCNFVKV